MKLGSSKYWFGLNKAVICWIVTLGRHDTHIFLCNRKGILAGYMGYAPNASFINSVQKELGMPERRFKRWVAFLDERQSQIRLPCDSYRAFSILIRACPHYIYLLTTVRRSGATVTCLPFPLCTWERQIMGTRQLDTSTICRFSSVDATWCGFKCICGPAGGAELTHSVWMWQQDRNGGGFNVRLGMTGKNEESHHSTSRECTIQPDAGLWAGPGGGGAGRACWRPDGWYCGMPPEYSPSSVQEQR